MDERNIEEENAFLKAELLQSRQRGVSATVLLFVRLTISLVLLVLAAFLYYLGYLGVTGDGDEVALATTNGGTLIITAVSGHWLTFRQPKEE